MPAPHRRSGSRGSAQLRPGVSGGCEPRHRSVKGRLVGGATRAPRAHAPQAIPRLAAPLSQSTPGLVERLAHERHVLGRAGGAANCARRRGAGARRRRAHSSGAGLRRGPEAWSVARATQGRARQSARAPTHRGRRSTAPTAGPRRRRRLRPRLRRWPRSPPRWPRGPSRRPRRLRPPRGPAARPGRRARAPWVPWGRAWGAAGLTRGCREKAIAGAIRACSDRVET
jgi:hypothetical protein